MKFRAKKNQSKYKDVDHYIDAVYNNNKDIINNTDAFKNKKSKKSIFRKLVKEKMSQGMSVKKAIDTLQKSRIFTSEAQHYAQNALKALKKDKRVYHTFRKLKGWKEKLEMSKFNYAGSDGKYSIYTYGDITIKIKDSPTEGVGGIELEQNGLPVSLEE